MPVTWINGQMVETPAGYNPLTDPSSPMYQAPGVVQAANAGPGGWGSQNIPALAGSGFQFDPRFQANSNPQVNAAYDALVRQTTGQQLGPAPGTQGVIGGNVQQQYNSGVPLQPTQPQSQLAPGNGMPQAPPAPSANAPSPNTGGQRGGTGTAGVGPQQPATAPAMNPMQQLQQTGFGVPFSPNFIPPQAFAPRMGQQGGGMDLNAILSQLLSGMGGQMGQQGYGVSQQQQLGFGPGMGGAYDNPQVFGSPFGGFQQGGMQTQMFNPFGGQAPQQQAGPNLTALLLQLLGGF